MNFGKYQNLLTGDEEYTLALDGDELKKIKLSETDRRLLDECAESNKISDKLLALETIARRIEESEQGITK